MNDNRSAPPTDWSSPATVATATPAHPHGRDRSAALPARAARLLERAQRWIERRDFGAAEQSMREVARIVPGDAEVLRLLAVAVQSQGRHTEAVALLRRALALHPDDPLIENNLGSALGESGDLEAALLAFQRVTQAAPSLAASWFNLGKAHDALLQTAEAEAAFARALTIEPAHVGARVLRAGTLRTLGRLDAAAAEFRAALAVHPRSAEAWSGLVGMKSSPISADELRTLEALHRDGRLDQGSRSLIGFAYALALETEARHDEAFGVVMEINAAKRAGSVWDAALFSGIVRDIARAFDDPVAGTDEAALGDEVIFMVGMPRSGSTLAEQILSAHPQVCGAGETGDLAAVIREESARRGIDFPGWIADATPADWHRLGHEYLHRTAHWRRSAPRFTDKSLHNWQLVGVIRAMLPGACVIDCRRDRLETCWSSFKHDFGGNMPFTNDIDDLAAYWHDYDRLMRFWHARYPDFIWIQDYEALLTDPEPRIRALLARCGLAFDPACLRFQDVERDVRTASAGQVRAPLRHDTARAHLYGRHLDPLRRALEQPGAANRPA